MLNSKPNYVRFEGEANEKIVNGSSTSVKAETFGKLQKILMIICLVLFIISGMIFFSGRLHWSCKSSSDNEVFQTKKTLISCPPIISRKEWAALPPKLPPTFMKKPGHYAFIHHSEAPDHCFTREACTRSVQAIQRYHMDHNKWNDIGYSFLIGDDGNVYEGRGWNVVGSHTKGYNSIGLGFCFIGNFNKKLPKPNTLNIAKQLLKCAGDNKYLESAYVLRGHRDMNPSTECPGQMLYDKIKTWPHY